jgi:hypothetical protein
VKPSRSLRTVALLAPAAVPVVAGLLLAAPAAQASAVGVLVAGDRLAPGGFVRSNPDRYLLRMQTDGNLVEYRISDGRAVWSSGTAGHAGASLVVQKDGNVVVYAGNGPALWSTRTAGAGNTFSVQSDGNMVVYSAGHRALWASGVPVPPAGTGDTLYPGQSIRSDAADHDLTSRNGRVSFGPINGGVVADEQAAFFGSSLWFRDDTRGGGQDVVSLLTMQTDGNLVLRGVNGVAYWNAGSSGAGNRFVVQDDGNFVVRRPDGSAAWASGTTRTLLAPGETAPSGRRFVWNYTSFDPTYVTVVQGDGNVVTYGPGNRAVWQTGTAGNPGASLTMQTDGNLLVRRPDGRAVWQSGTSGCGPAVYSTALGTIYGENGRVWTTSGGREGAC